MNIATINLENPTMLNLKQLKSVEARNRTYRPGGYVDQMLRRQLTTHEDAEDTPARAPCPGGDRGDNATDEPEESVW